MPSSGPLHFELACDAAYDGDVKALKRILRAENLAKHVDKVIGSPLHFATTSGVAKLLLSHGADIEAKNGWGRTPLQSKADAGNVEVAQYLIAQGANVDTGHDAESGTPLFIATISRHYNPDMVQLLKRHVKLLDLRTAVVVFDSLAIRKALARDPDAVKRCRWRDDLLHLAVAEAFFRCERAEPRELKKLEKEHADIVAILVGAGVPVDAHGHSRKCPLHWAAECESRHLVELLLSHGADPEAKSEEGTTPSESARSEEFREWMAAKTKGLKRKRRRAKE